MGREVILLRIVVEMLAAIDKIETGHTSLGAFARKIKFGEVLGKTRTDRTKDPIKIASALHTGAFMRKIPDVTSPRLQFNELHGRVLHQLNFDEPRVHGICSRLRVIA